tara:strand:- start:5355 stop:6143 length:789 start_codon:yes stop_codon:yes gene_type:complete
MGISYKIFDTVTHPTINGKWIDGRKGENFNDFKKTIGGSPIRSVCAIGLPNIGEYSHEKFYKKCSEQGKIFAVGAITKDKIKKILKEIEIMHNIGFSGIKIHPRLLKHEFSVDELALIFSHCSDLDITVFLCTYYQCKINNFPSQDPFWVIVNSLKRCPDARVVLLHGGGVRILEYAELVRFNKNIILELSLTLTKYTGSSIDLDLKYLFSNFDQRICLGSDHPEMNYQSFFNKLDYFFEGLPKKKISNICYRNIERFLKIK